MNLLLALPTKLGRQQNSWVERRAIPGALPQTPGFCEACLGCSMGCRKRTAPDAVQPGQLALSTHPRSGYPLPGCVPAEPDSVSPDKNQYSEERELANRCIL